MDPGSANADDSGLADEVRAADVVILSTMYDNWHEPNTSMEPGSDEPNQVLEDEFCLVDSYGDNAADRAARRPSSSSTSAVTDTAPGDDGDDRRTNGGGTGRRPRTIGRPPIGRPRDRHATGSTVCTSNDVWGSA